MPEFIDKQAHAAELLLFPGCDPKNKLSDLFEKNQISSKPELAILDWLVALPTTIDPAFAAQSVLMKLKSNQSQFNEDQQNIINLLSEITCHPRDELYKVNSRNARGHRRRHWLKQTHKRTLV